MSYRIEFHGSFHVDTEDQVRDEGLFLQSAIQRLLPSGENIKYPKFHISATNFEHKNRHLIMKKAEDKGFSGKQTVSSIALKITTLLVKSEAVTIPEKEVNDFQNFVKVEDGIYVVDYRALFVALNAHAVNSATFKDQFKAAVAEANLSGISLK